MNEVYKVVDDILPENVITDLENIFIKNEKFDWYLSSYGTSSKQPISVGEDNKIYEDYQLTHTFYLNGMVGSQNSYIIDSIKDKLNINGIVRAKANLQFKSSKVIENGYNTPHLDVYDNKDLYIAVLMVNNSDGDTVIFNDNKQIRIPFRRNRIIYLKGGVYHAGNHPKNNDFRIVINFNFYRFINE